jgi:hypothetical protein
MSEGEKREKRPAQVVVLDEAFEHEGHDDPLTLCERRLPEARDGVCIATTCARRRRARPRDVAQGARRGQARARAARGAGWHAARDLVQQGIGGGGRAGRTGVERETVDERGGSAAATPGAMCLFRTASSRLGTGADIDLNLAMEDRLR